MAVLCTILAGGLGMTPGARAADGLPHSFEDMLFAPHPFTSPAPQGTSWDGGQGNGMVAPGFGVTSGARGADSMGIAARQPGLLSPAPVGGEPIFVADTGPGSGISVNPDQEQSQSGGLSLYALDECRGSCAFSLYVGVGVEDHMEDIFINSPSFPTSWDYRDSGLIAATFSKKLVNFYDWAVLEPEVGIAKRFGKEDEYEFWAALYLRWMKFPWNDYVKTTLGLPIGMNYATGIAEIEKDRADGGDTSRWLHFFSPELTFALPEYENEEVFVRFHHRSGGYGLITDGGGANYLSLGYRHRF
ncbi:hypothetical protein [Sneathiella chinensis]|nr:hypothetical protein [Sneathiella chinensis]